MNRYWLSLVVLSFLGLAAAADAAPRVVGGVRFGGGGGVRYGVAGGYRYGGGAGVRVVGGGVYRGPAVGVYGGRAYGYGRYPYRGAGFGLWFTPSLYSTIPYTVRGGAYPAATYSIPSYYGAPADPAEPIPASNEWGLQITDVTDGPAKTADLRKGDIILGVGQVRTQTLDELQKALAATRGQTDIVFINGESKNVEKLPITPKDGKIGIAVQPVDLP